MRGGLISFKAILNYYYKKKKKEIFFFFIQIVCIAKKKYRTTTRRRHVLIVSFVCIYIILAVYLPSLKVRHRLPYIDP